TLLQGPDYAIQSRYFGHYLTPSRGKFNRTNTTAGSSTSWPKSLRRLLGNLGYLIEIVAHAILKGVKRGTEASATQLRYVCAREILILLPKFFRRVYEPDIRRTSDHSTHGPN